MMPGTLRSGDDCYATNTTSQHAARNASQPNRRGVLETAP
jgi:hypothetical protein